MRMLWFASSLALATLAAGCTEQVDCEREAAGLASWVQSIPKASRLDPITPVVAYDGPADVLTVADEKGTSFVVDKEGVSSMGQKLWDPTASREELALAVREKIEIERDRRALETDSDDVQLPTVAVTIAPDAPWSSVAATLEGVALIAGVGGARMALVFEKSGAAARGRPPGPSKLDAQLAQITASTEMSEKATQLAGLFQKTIESCKPAQKVMQELAVASPESKEGRLKEELPRAVAECKCKCDMAALRAILWAILASQKPAAVVKVVITAAASEAATTIALPAATPWRESYGKLVEARKNGSIAVAVQ
jgi:hypothetical protein